ncbi:MAG: ABC transporter permease subunit [Armatimonadetes bacterium]|nr:ABC transporter permease subunit [Candidatus Hippobium faecium]
MIYWIIAKTTFSDAIRQKVLQIFMVVAIALIIMSIAFAQTLTFSTQGSGGDLSLVKSFGLGMITIAGILIAVMNGVYMVPREIERKTIYTILSKPVNRWEFVVGKMLGSWLTLGAAIGLMGIVFLAVITFKAIGMQSANTTSIAIQAGLQEASTASVQIFDFNMLYGVILAYLQVVLLSSIIIMFSTFLTPTVNFFMGVAVYIVGSLITIIETLKNSPELGQFSHMLYEFVYAIIPNFDKFNVTNTLLHPGDAAVDIVYILMCLAYTLFYSLIATLIAVIVFQNKEV